MKETQKTRTRNPEASHTPAQSQYVRASHKDFLNAFKDGATATYTTRSDLHGLAFIWGNGKGFAELHRNTRGKPPRVKVCKLYALPVAEDTHFCGALFPCRRGALGKQQCAAPFTSIQYPERYRVCFKGMERRTQHKLRWSATPRWTPIPPPDIQCSVKLPK